MTKADLVKAVSEKANCPKKDAEMAINTVIDCITDAVAQGEKVQIVGFGTFEVRERREEVQEPPHRRGNDHTGKEGSRIQGR